MLTSYNNYLQVYPTKTQKENQRINRRPLIWGLTPSALTLYPNGGLPPGAATLYSNGGLNPGAATLHSNRVLTDPHPSNALPL